MKQGWLPAALNGFELLFNDEKNEIVDFESTASGFMINATMKESNNTPANAIKAIHASLLRAMKGFCSFAPWRSTFPSWSDDDDDD